MFLKKLLKVVFKGKDGPRSAFRVEIPNMRAKLSGRPVTFSTRDISATGIGLRMPGRPFKVGTSLELNLFLGSELLLKSVRAVVVRIGKDFVGCEFRELGRNETKILHEIVLVEQKKLADIKKKAGERSDGD